LVVRDAGMVRDVKGLMSCSQAVKKHRTELVNKLWIIGRCDLATGAALHFPDSAIPAFCLK